MTMLKAEEPISQSQKEIQIRHSTTNIKRTLALMRRAVLALVFASASLEGTETPSMVEDIEKANRSLMEAMRYLVKYEEDK